VPLNNHKGWHKTLKADVSRPPYYTIIPVMLRWALALLDQAKPQIIACDKHSSLFVKKYRLQKKFFFSLCLENYNQTGVLHLRLNDVSPIRAKVALTLFDLTARF